MKVNVPIPSAIGSPPLKLLSPEVPEILQVQTEWCWATCATMVVHFYGSPNANKCDFANWLFTQTTCCINPDSNNCNQGCQTDDIKKVYSQWGIESTINGSVTSNILVAEIDANRPIEVRFAWDDGYGGYSGGHVVLVVGYENSPSPDTFLVNDPWYGQGFHNYNELMTAYGKGVWSNTWTGIQKAAGLG
ncbi:MAG TPA: C39 family peptidase [Bacteroidia bacterium]|jgi:hypothetical protein|nr:C39 family peptidase [Bacteroidia bacterium]